MFTTEGDVAHVAFTVLPNVYLIGIMNTEIAQDPSLGSGFVIGHSYFCAQEAVTEDWLRAVVDLDLLPMLEEYWFDDPAKVETWRGRLRGVLPG